MPPPLAGNAPFGLLHLGYESKQTWAVMLTTNPHRRNMPASHIMKPRRHCIGKAQCGEKASATLIIRHENSHKKGSFLCWLRVPNSLFAGAVSYQFYKRLAEFSFAAKHKGFSGPRQKREGDRCRSSSRNFQNAFRPYIRRRALSRNFMAYSCLLQSICVMRT